MCVEKPDSSSPVDDVRTATAPVIRIAGADADGLTIRADMDALAVEEPLEIRLAHHVGDRLEERSVSITMRTPGHDLELAAGFLAGEGLLRDRADLADLKACGPMVDGRQNTVRVELARGAAIDLDRLSRHFYTTSSCGVCGKSSLEALRVAGTRPLGPGLRLDPAVVPTLPERLREAQAAFDRDRLLLVVLEGHAAHLVGADGAGRLGGAPTHERGFCPRRVYRSRTTRRRPRRKCAPRSRA
jgi:formate dehydrogenase assembly factor FdhD